MLLHWLGADPVRAPAGRPQVFWARTRNDSPEQNTPWPPTCHAVMAFLQASPTVERGTQRWAVPGRAGQAGPPGSPSLLPRPAACVHSGFQHPKWGWCRSGGSSWKAGGTQGRCRSPRASQQGPSTPGGVQGGEHQDHRAQCLVKESRSECFLGKCTHAHTRTHADSVQVGHLTDSGCAAAGDG